MKKIIICLIIIGCFFSGCAKQDDNSTDFLKPEPTDYEQQDYEPPDYELNVESMVDRENCFICGDRSNSLMPYYAKRDSVGIVFWGEPSISDTDVRTYDDDGNELFGQHSSSTQFSSFGEGYGSIMTSGNPNRGYTNVSVHFTEKDEVDFNSIKKLLCQDCLDSVVEFYVDQNNYGEEDRLGTTGYCLVDFVTKKLYTLSDPYRGYFIRDYYVSYDIVESSDMKNNHIELFVMYAPERTE